jgi:hypothetical protein
MVTLLGVNHKNKNESGIFLLHCKREFLNLQLGEDFTT